jgi:hypothetical protein
MVKPNRQEMIKDLLQLAAKLFRISLPIVPREILDLDAVSAFRGRAQADERPGI